ncbi:MAG: hypothetical protein O7H41_14475 [Planctomycetota bacterium]|nr:hypothetical protein [Planctomycetota bacterium]
MELLTEDGEGVALERDDPVVCLDCKRAFDRGFTRGEIWQSKQSGKLQFMFLCDGVEPNPGAQTFEIHELGLGGIAVEQTPFVLSGLRLFARLMFGFESQEEKDVRVDFVDSEDRNLFTFNATVTPEVDPGAPAKVYDICVSFDEVIIHDFGTHRVRLYVDEQLIKAVSFSVEKKENTSQDSDPGS